MSTPEHHVVMVGKIVYTVKMLRELYECGALDEFTYQRYKRLAKVRLEPVPDPEPESAA